LKNGGTLVSIIPPSTPELEAKAAEKNIALTILIGDVNKEVMSALAILLQDGRLKPYVSTNFAFSQMAEAHIAIESKRTVGKIVVEI
jgi:NADPH:quinone reductase-like Zn-dependent oxidoreductase